MEDPVINAAGQTYGVPQTPCTACPQSTARGVPLTYTQLPAERAAIEKWIARGKRTDPMSGSVLESTFLVPNVLVRGMYRKYAAA